MVRAVRYVRRGKACVTYRFDSENQIFYKVGDQAFRSTSFESVGNFHAPACALLNNGNVLFVGGGKYPEGSKAVMEHDVINNVFMERAELPIYSRDMGVVTLGDGRVLGIGGWVGDDETMFRANNTIRIYDPVANAWTEPCTATYTLTTPRMMPDGRVLLQGATLWIYDVDLAELWPLQRTRDFVKLLEIDPHGVITYVTEHSCLRSEDPHEYYPPHESEWGVSMWTAKRHHLYGAQVRYAATAIALILMRAEITRGHIQMVLDSFTADRFAMVHLSRAKLRSRRAPGVLATANMQLVSGT